MTRLRQSRWASTFFVAAAMLVWFVASNHCAFAGIEPARVAAHSCCHEEGKSAPPVSGAVMQCCDTFNVALPAMVAAPEIQLYELRPLWMEVSLLPEVSSVPACLPRATTGPPRALGFAEIVLNRSLLSHAPPRFVA
ncbi:MAG TPA: hypothetical protein VNB29_03735 [Chthoniobacterales bacterium]|nr:hypothetical protein [Chthoniobacterales bacterium]